MTYQTTIQQLIETFRQGALALIPTMERAHIRWRGDTYDDWERIIEALFRSIVKDSIESATVAGAISLPEYDRQYPNYAALDYICVVTPIYEGESLVFHSLQSSRAPFDTVRCAHIRNDKSIIGMIEVALEESRFAVYVRGSRTLLESVHVEL